MSPENDCPKFKQNAWKKDLCSNCFRPKEEHPQKPKRVHVDYKPLPEISPDQSILKGKGACEKSLSVSFSNVEYEVIGYGGEEYSTDEDYSSDDDDHLVYPDSAEEDELKRLTEANTNMNGKLNMVPEKSVTNAPVTKITPPKAVSPKTNGLKVTEKSSSSPLVTIKPFGGDPEPKSLVYSFLKNKEISAAAKKETPVKTTSVVLTNAEEKLIGDPAVNCTKDDVPIRKTENKKTSLVRSSLLASSNESYLNVKRTSFLETEATKSEQVLDTSIKKEVPEVKPSISKSPQSEETKTERLKEKELKVTTDTPLTPPKEPEPPAIDMSNTASYKMRSNVPRMGTAQFKIKMPAAIAPFQKSDSCKTLESPESLISRELAGEPDGKADSDEPNEQQSLLPITPSNRSFLHSFSKEKSPPPPPPPPCDTPPRTPLRKTSSGSPPECPRSIKRQAPKPPPTPPSPMIICANNNSYFRRQESGGSVSDDESEGLNKKMSANSKLLAEYCEQIEKEKELPNNNENIPIVESVETSTRESTTLPLPVRRASYEKKKYGKAARVGSKIKKFLRIPSKESVTALPQPPSRPKLEIIHPLDINKSGVEIIHNVDLIHHIEEKKMKDLTTKMMSQHHPARPSKPPPPPRSQQSTPRTMTVQNNSKLTEYCDDMSKTCDSSTSDETYEPINYSAPECDHSSPEMARLTSMQYCGSETESEIYPVIQFGDDFGIEDSVRNTQTKNHKSLEESYDAVVIANHEALSKLLEQASECPKIPKELMMFQTKSLEWSSFRIDSTSRLQKGEYAFYNSKWYDVPVVLSISTKEVKLKNVLKNHFTLTKISQFIGQIGKEFSINNENEEAYITLWNAHRIESIESYCKDYNAKYSDINKEAGLILVEIVNLLMGLQASDVEKYSLQPFVISRNLFGTDPTIAIIQVETDLKEEDTLCNIMLNILKLLAPTWEMTICLSQVLRQGKANSLSKCKALLEFWLWGPTGVTVSPDRPLSLKRWLDLERANTLHSHVCAHFTNLTVQQICYLSFLVANDEKLLNEVRTIMADHMVQSLGNNLKI